MLPPPERIIPLYEENAAAWDRLRSRELEERGCGSGEPIARHLIERGYRVTGLAGAAGLTPERAGCSKPGLKAAAGDSSCDWEGLK